MQQTSWLLQFRLENPPWRIIPFRKWLIIMVIVFAPDPDREGLRCTPPFTHRYGILRIGFLAILQGSDPWVPIVTQIESWKGIRKLDRFFLLLTFLMILFTKMGVSNKNRGKTPPKWMGENHGKPN